MKEIGNDINMEIKKITNKKLNTTIPLIRDVFCSYEAVHYPEAGKQAFGDTIHSDDYLNSLNAYGAYEDEKLIGIIAIGKEDSHVALFYVDEKYQNQGIGKRLWNVVLEKNTFKVITVHSPINAVEIYKKLGFIQTGDTVCENGISYVPMEYRMIINENCICKRNKCVRHGKCNECRAYYARTKRQIACEKNL